MYQLIAATSASCANTRRAGEISVEPVQIFRQVLAELSLRDATELRRILNKLARRVRELASDREEAP